MNANYFCPICGYTLEFMPWDGDIPSEEICPCCGNQFGYNDFAGGNPDKRFERWSDLRKQWINNGAPWFSKSTKAPKDWNPKNQLRNIDSA